jgi:hypothetical protein
MATADTALTGRTGTTAIPIAAPATGIVAAGLAALVIAAEVVFPIRRMFAAGSAHITVAVSVSRGGVGTTAGPGMDFAVDGGITGSRQDQRRSGQM